MIKFLLFLISFQLHASTDLAVCGLFNVGGVIKSNIKETGYSLIVNAGARSEYAINIKMDEELKIIPYVNHPVSINGLILTKARFHKSEFHTIKSLTRIAPDPLNVRKENGFQLIKQEKCLK